MNVRRANPLAPSSTVALYLATVISIYLVPGVAASLAAAFALCVVALAAARRYGAPISRARWRAASVFVIWVLLMRIALEAAGGGSVSSSTTLALAARGAARIAVLLVIGLAVIAVTPARAIVEELETTRLPRAIRLLVMMLVQYPRVLRDRYDQIVEAQVARGADRPRTVVDRVVYALRILLPVLQSELNAIGERAGLIHLRRLDVETAALAGDRRRGLVDLAAITLAGVAIVLVIAWRIATR